MKFWKGNRLDGEFDMPVLAVADKFMGWYREQAEEYQEQIPLERALRYWLSSPDGLNSVWEDETGTESFEDLYDAVRDKVWT